MRTPRPTLERALASLPQDPAGTAPVDLGPATVLEPGAGEVWATLRSGRDARVQLALGFLYQPSAGDVLLVISQGGEHYAIGVLQAQAPPSLSVAGDLALHAVGGKLKLVGDEGVVLQTAGEATIQAGSLRTVAGAVVERLASVTRWVSGQINLRAGGVARVIDGTETTLSENSYHTAKESIKIDSHQVHLGH